MGNGREVGGQCTETGICCDRRSTSETGGKEDEEDEEDEEEGEDGEDEEDGVCSVSWV